MVSGAEKAGNAWHGIQGAVSDAADAVQDFGSRATSAISSAGSAAWSGITDGAEAAATGMKAAAAATLEFSRSALVATGTAIKEAAAFVWDKTTELAAAVADKAMAAAQWLLDAAMDANPITLIIIGLIALVASVIYCWDHFSGFRDFLIAAWGMISGAASDAWGLLKSCFDGIVSAVGSVVDFVRSHWQLLLAILTGPIGLAVYAITHYWHDISSAFSDAWSAVKSIAGDGIHFVESIPGKILSALGDVGSLLWSAGENIVQGLINGIESMVGSAGSAMGSVVSEIKKFLPWSPAKKGPLSGSGAPQIGGRNIAKQLAQGLLAGTADVTAAMSHLTGAASGKLALSMSAAGSLHAVGSGVAAGSGGTTYNVTVQVAGTVVSEKNLRDQIQKAFLQLGMRNSKTYQPYAR
jgi:phage-related protein